MLKNWLYGCANFGGIGTPEHLIGKGDSPEEAIRNCDQALDMGITTFDNANTYAAGAAEIILGQWLKKLPALKKSQVRISTKVGNKSSTVKGGLSKSHIREQIEVSLSRFNRDYVDILFLHFPDPLTPLEETFECFDSLVKEGKVLALGAWRFQCYRRLSQRSKSNLRGKLIYKIIIRTKSF